MENDRTGQPWDPTKPMGLGTGEGEVPLAPPAQKLDARTMSSDLRSMQQSGGAMPRPFVPQNASSLPAPTPARPSVATAPVPQVPQPPRPATAPTHSTVSIAAPATKKKGGRGAFVIGLVAIVVVGLGALGYFVLYPMVFGETAVPAPTVSDESSATEPLPLPEEPVTPETSPVPEAEIPTEAPLFVHASFFKATADSVSALTLANLTFPSFKSQLFPEIADVPLFKEWIVKGAGGEPMTLKQFAGTAFPSVFTSDIAAQFEADVTVFSFTNEKGTWLGFVAKRKSVASADLGTRIAELENAPTLAEFFLTAPGTMQSWKSGVAGTTNTRYVTFSLAGAALNYGWFSDYLIVSGSYDGFKDALRRLE